MGIFCKELYWEWEHRAHGPMLASFRFAFCRSPKSPLRAVNFILRPSLSTDGHTYRSPVMQLDPGHMDCKIMLAPLGLNDCSLRMNTMYVPCPTPHIELICNSLQPLTAQKKAPYCHVYALTDLAPTPLYVLYNTLKLGCGS